MRLTTTTAIALIAIILAPLILATPSQGESGTLSLLITPAPNGIYVDGVFKSFVAGGKAGRGQGLFTLLFETKYDRASGTYILTLNSKFEALTPSASMGTPTRATRIPSLSVTVNALFEGVGLTGNASFTAQFNTPNGTIIARGVVVSSLPKENTSKTTITATVLVPPKAVTQNLIKNLNAIEALMTPYMVNMMLARSNITWAKVQDLEITHNRMANGTLEIDVKLTMIVDYNAMIKAIELQSPETAKAMAKMLQARRKISYEGKLVLKTLVNQTQAGTHVAVGVSCYTKVKGDVEDYLKLLQNYMYTYMKYLMSKGILTVAPTRPPTPVATTPPSGRGVQVNATKKFLRVLEDLEPWTKLYILPDNSVLLVEARTTSSGATVEIAIKHLRLGYDDLKGEEATVKAASMLLTLLEAAKKQGLSVSYRCEVPEAKPVENLMPRAEAVFRDLLASFKAATTSTPWVTGTMTRTGPTTTTVMPTTPPPPPATIVKTVTVTVTTILVTVATKTTTPLTITVSRPVTLTLIKTTTKTIATTVTKTVLKTLKPSATTVTVTKTRVVQVSRGVPELYIVISIVLFAIGLGVGVLIGRK